MANNYNVITASTVGGAGGVTTVYGTVNGQYVTITFPAQVFASTAAFQAFVQPLMLAAAALPIAGMNGSFVL